jgi:hypothetical protein
VDERPTIARLRRVARLVDPDPDAPIEVALLRRMAALVVVVMFGLVVPTNRLLGLPFIVDVVAASVGLVSAGIVWASQRGRHLFGPFWAMNLVGLNLAYFVSFGADGSVLYWFGPLAALTVGLFNGGRRLLAMLVLGLDGLALLAADFWRPQLVARPMGEATRFQDLATGHFSSLLSTAVVVGLLVSAYRREQARREATSLALAGSEDEVRTLRGLLAICGWCKKIRTDGETWVALERYVAAHTDATFTHGICPNCMEDHFGEEPEGGLGPSP